MNKFKQIKIDCNFKLKIISYMKSMTWDEAQAWAKEQGGRVPTVAELQILLGLQRMGKIDTKFTGWFWSSEEYSNNPRHYGKDVFFSSGIADNDYKYFRGQVICIKDM